MALFIVAISLSGCASYTMLSHPEVEVYDERLEKYVFEEVTLASNCQSCHANQPSKFDVYRRLSRTTGSASSIEKIDLLQARAMPELRGYEHYLHSDLGSYYYAAWWFNPVIVESGFYGASASGGATSASERVRQSYRRSFGRAAQSAAPASAAQPAGRSAPAAAATAATAVETSSPSSSQQGARASSEAGGASKEHQGSRQSSGESKSESAPRSSGRARE